MSKPSSVRRTRGGTAVRKIATAKLAVVIAGASIAFTGPANGDSLVLSGGVDARYSHATPPARDRVVLKGLFLNLRKTWSDEFGDRWIGVAQGDFDDNFDRIRPYQVFLQYKGPLGRWNLRAGHYLLPFGLLATYDTERLVLRGLEETSLGIRKDTGLSFLGHLGAWDYAVSVTDGLGDHRLADLRARPLFIARLAQVSDEWQVGLSAFVGEPLRDEREGDTLSTARERRAALDLTVFRGPLTLRAEGIAGTNDGSAVGGGLVLADYLLRPELELNTRLAAWSEGAEEYGLGAGFTYQLPWPGLFFRLADQQRLGGPHRNEVTVQLSYEFSRSL